MRPVSSFSLYQQNCRIDDSTMILATPLKSQLLDTYMAFLVLTGIIQFVYALLVGTFPYNAFLSGFGVCVGAFCLAGNFFFFVKALIIP